MGKQPLVFLLAAAMATLPVRPAEARDPLPGDEPVPSNPIAYTAKPSHYRGNLQARLGFQERALAHGGDDDFQWHERGMSLLCGGLNFNGFSVEFCYARSLSEQEHSRRFVLDTKTNNQTYNGRLPTQKVTITDKDGSEHKVEIHEQDIVVDVEGGESTVTLVGTQRSKRRQVYANIGMTFAGNYDAWWSSDVSGQIPLGVDVKDSTITFSGGDTIPKYKLNFLMGVQAQGEVFAHLPSRYQTYFPLAIGVAGSAGYVADELDEIGDSRGGANLSATLLVKLWPPQLEENW